MTVLFALMALFAVNNQDALQAFEQQRNDGLTWEYVGKQPRDPAAPAIPIIREDTGEEFIYFKLTEKNK